MLLSRVHSRHALFIVVISFLKICFGQVAAQRFFGTHNIEILALAKFLAMAKVLEQMPARVVPRAFGEALAKALFMALAPIPDPGLGQGGGQGQDGPGNSYIITS
jgi:hypothetical protein